MTDTTNHDNTSMNGHAPDKLLSVTVSDILDYFEKCPRCGYPAQATATVRTFKGGRVETSVQAMCALPCGWQGAPRASGPR